MKTATIFRLISSLGSANASTFVSFNLRLISQRISKSSLMLYYSLDHPKLNEDTKQRIMFESESPFKRT